jgi:hypothetical protein
LKKHEIIFWLIAGVITAIFIKPIDIYGIVLFMLFHELGHAMVASYYGAFRGFGFFNMTVATKVETDAIPKKALSLTICSGMILNVLSAFILIPIFSFNDGGIAGYMLLVIGCGLGDIYCLIKGKPFGVDEK